MTAVVKSQSILLPVHRALQLTSKLRTYSMVLALALIWVAFDLATDGAFLQSRNLSNLFRQMAGTGILAIGMVFIIVAGHIDLSVGSLACFIGAVLAILEANHGFGPWAAFAMAIATGAAIGFGQGYLTSYQRIPAFIVTLGGMMAFRGASMWLTQGVTIPLPENWVLALGNAYVPQSGGWLLTSVAVVLGCFFLVRERRLMQKYQLATGSVAILIVKMLAVVLVLGGVMSIFSLYEGLPVPVLVMAALLLIFHFLATQTIFGRHVYAIGGNLDAAGLSGIRVKARTLVVFTLMGVLSAVAGVILTARVGSASPDAGQLMELDAIASCVIGGTSLMGGRGTVFGALLGALIMESLNNGMSMANMDSFWQYIVKGSVLVVAVWADSMSQGQK